MTACHRRKKCNKYVHTHEEARMNLVARILPAANVVADLDVTSKKRVFEHAGLMFENNLGSYGMNLADLYDLLRDWIGMQKLQRLVAGNVGASPEMANQFYSATRQTIKAASIPFAFDNFKKSAQVSDDDIKQYYEQKKDSFKTPEKRAVSYVFFENPKDLDKVAAEERMKKNNAFGEKVQNFAIESIVEGADFDQLAKKFSAEVKKLPAFDQADAPIRVLGGRLPGQGVD